MYKLLACGALACGALVPNLHSQQELEPSRLGFHNGPDWISLRTDGSKFGVRFAPGTTEQAARQTIAQIPAITSGQSQTVPYLDGQTVYLEAVPGLSPRAAWEAAEEILRMDGVISASPRLFALEDPYFLTEEILVRWTSGVTTAQKESWTKDLIWTANLDYAVNPADVYQVPKDMNPLLIANQIAESGLVEFAIPDFQLLRVTMGGTNDPLFGDQWHIENTGQNGAIAGEDMNVCAAWNITRGLPSVTVAIVDTGVELGHPDLAPNLVQGTDVLSNDNHPQAENGWLGLFPESHSTSVHGVVAAVDDNNQGVTGIAPNCTLMPIRFLSEFLFPAPTVQDEADAFNFACNNGAAMINNSWGPAFAAALPASTKAAIDNCNDFGRGGLGSIVFFAAGNSGNQNNGNGYATYEGTVSVTASTDQGRLAGYSSFGPANDINGSSNGGRNGITTTDRLGSRGYSNGDYTSTFGGTSSASPAVVGVMALILSANPSLTRLEAMSILFSTAEKIDVAGGNYDVLGHSDKYGYGRADAGAAVNAAAGGVSTDSVLLSGDTVGNVGQTVTYTLQNGAPNSLYQIYAAFGLTGTIIGAQLFDISTPVSTLTTGNTDGSGNATWTSGPIPGNVAGRTVYLEAGVVDNAQTFDSNVVALMVN